MKKSYETPSVEKIKFNYRDQVVAASGDAVTGNTTQRINGWGDTVCGVGEVIGGVVGRLFDYAGSNICDIA